MPAADGTTDFFLDGRDLRNCRRMRRKAELKKIIAGTHIQFSKSFEINGHSDVRARLQGRAPRGRVEVAG